MDAVLYKEILLDYLFPFIGGNYGFHRAILHQDNDPKHTSKLCKGVLNRYGINWIKAPAKSPDLNPIEMVWNDLKTFVRSKGCISLGEMVTCIKEFEKALTPEKCQRYINKIHDVIQVVIDRKGGWSDF
jgi:transposase